MPILQRQTPPQLPQRPATAQSPHAPAQNHVKMPIDTKNTASKAVAAAQSTAVAPTPNAPPATVTSKPATASKSTGVRPPASMAKFELRHRLVMLSFVLFVMIPPVLAAVYLWGFASDQYNSKVGFSVRSEEGGGPLSMLGGLVGASNSSSSDTDILLEFIASQNLVAELDQELNLREIWSKTTMDPYYSINKEARLEEIVDYWRSMVHVSNSKGPGLIEVEVKAFDPKDAQLIATRLFEKSSEMINKLSDIARDDAIRFARTDLEEAEKRLSTARSAITDFRTQNNLVDPSLDVQSQAGLLGNLQSQHATALIELDVLRETVPASDPRITQVERRIRVIEDRIEAERRQKSSISGDGSRPYAELIGDYEKLTVEREFSQQAYVSALANYDAAVAEARRQSRYLAAYMEPTLAQSSIYPQRFMALITFSSFLLLAWSVGLLIFYSIRDRR